MREWWKGQVQVTLQRQKRFAELKHQQVLQTSKTDEDQKLTYILVAPRHVRLWALKRTQQKSTCHSSTRSWKQDIRKNPAFFNLQSQSWAWGLLGLIALTSYSYNNCFGSLIPLVLTLLLYVSEADYIHSCFRFPPSFMGEPNAHVYIPFTAFVLLESLYATLDTHDSLPTSSPLIHSWELSLKAPSF